MNREILFRGKYEDNKVKTWVYGTPQTNARGQTFICAGMNKGWDVDPLTVGQFTGLLDKNGKKIFEGDRLGATVNAHINKRLVDGPFGSVKDFDIERKKVVWSVEHKIFNHRMGYFVYGTDKRFHAPLTHNVIWNCDVEIIGNIHDNPELGGDT